MSIWTTRLFRCTFATKTALGNYNNFKINTHLGTLALELPPWCCRLHLTAFALALPPSPDGFQNPELRAEMSVSYLHLYIQSLACFVKLRAQQSMVGRFRDGHTCTATVNLKRHKPRELETRTNFISQSPDCDIHRHRKCRQRVALNAESHVPAVRLIPNIIQTNVERLWKLTQDDYASEPARAWVVILVHITTKGVRSITRNLRHLLYSTQKIKPHMLPDAPVWAEADALRRQKKAETRGRFFSDVVPLRIGKELIV